MTGRPKLPSGAFRTPIQITAAKGQQEYPDLFVICDDGTMWQLLNYETEWKPLPEIPQPE